MTVHTSSVALKKKKPEERDPGQGQVHDHQVRRPQARGQAHRRRQEVPGLEAGSYQGREHHHRDRGQAHEVDRAQPDADA